MKDLNDLERAALGEVGGRMGRARRDPRARLTQSAIAKRVGVSQPRVSRWETGTAIPSVIELFRFATACGERPERFVEDIVAPSAEQMQLQLDDQAKEVVTDLIRILLERPPKAEVEPG